MRWLLVGLLIIAPIVLPADARALPGDPPIVPLTPADGAAVAADASGIPVTFQCPAYSIAVYTAGGTTFTDRGDNSDYAVRFASDPAVGADGRLATQPYGSDAGTSLGADGLTCTAKLDTYDTARSPEIVGGRVYWQAYRYCNGCAQGWEAGPVQSFVVRPDVQARLTAPARVYAGEAARFAGLVAAKRGDVATAEARLDAAIALMRELGYRYELAKVLLHRGELLLDTDRRAESIAFIDEARALLAALGARPLLVRAEQALAGRPASAA